MSDVRFNGRSLSSTGMPQLDIRDVFAATQDETGRPAPAFAVLPDPLSPGRPRFAERFGHSEWANISFVTIALAGGLFFAFYFFNGADLLQAAGRWAREFLYPQPLSTPVNNFAAPTEDAVAAAKAADATSQSSANSSSGPFGRDYWPGNLTTPTSFASASDGGASGSAGGAFGTVVGSAFDQLSTLRGGSDNLFRTLYQNVPIASGLNSATRKSIGSTRKTISKTGGLVLQRTPVTSKPISNSNGNSAGVQQTANAAQSGRSSPGFNPGLGPQGLAGQLGLGSGRGAAGGGGVGGGGLGGALGGLGLGGGRGGR